MSWYLSEENTRVLRSILTARCKTGATIEEIRADFYELCGELPDLYNQNFTTIKQCMQSMLGVYCVIEQKLYLWYYNGSKVKHIADMVEQQKPPRHCPISRPGAGGDMHRKHFHRSATTCFFKDNNNFRLKRQFYSEPSLSSSHNRSYGSQDSNGGHNNRTSRVNRRPAYFYEYQLLGDDFFIGLAISELNCTADRGQILKCGLCVSGQTIADAIVRIESLHSSVDKNIIVNIGSVDLLHGHEYVDMKTDFMQLYEAFDARGITPIITTLAPLANQGHNFQTRRNWERFNAFLMTFPQVLDIRPCFVTSNGHTLHDCFQPMAKYVTGSNQPHALWNRVGRQRILSHLKKEVIEILDVIER